MNGRIEREREKHLSIREYAGCPHCGCPVNIRAELGEAVGAVATFLLPHARKGTRLRRALDELALSTKEDEWTATRDLLVALTPLGQLQE
jgi:hypothetical protein